MWFCMKCEWWYHVDCCEVVPCGRTYASLEDFVTMPLLRGGGLGLMGTAPLAFAAAQVVQTVQREGEKAVVNWKALLDEVSGCSADDLLAEQAERFVTSEMKCRNCGG